MHTQRVLLFSIVTFCAIITAGSFTKHNSLPDCYSYYNTTIIQYLYRERGKNVEYRIKLAAWGSFLTLPASLLQNLKACTGNALKLILLIFAQGEAPIEPQALAKTLGISHDEVFDCLNYWAKQGLLTQTVEAEAQQQSTEQKPIPSGKRPRYSRGEVLDHIKSNKSLSGLVTHLQEIKGVPLTSLDLDCVVGMYSYYGLTPHFISTVAQHCTTIGKPHLPYIEKTAANWAMLGIDDSNINRHIESIEQYLANEGRVRRLLGLKDRVLSAKDKEAISRWCSEYKLSDELIEFAHQITLANTSKVSISYQDTILTRWYKAGITELSAAKEDNQRFASQLKSERKSPAAQPADPNNPYNTSNIASLLEEQFLLEVSQTETNEPQAATARSR